jgi:hypothetical protein
LEDPTKKMEKTKTVHEKPRANDVDIAPPIRHRE